MLKRRTAKGRTGATRKPAAEVQSHRHAFAYVTVEARSDRPRGCRRTAASAKESKSKAGSVPTAEVTSERAPTRLHRTELPCAVLLRAALYSPATPVELPRVDCPADRSSPTRRPTPRYRPDMSRDLLASHLLSTHQQGGSQRLSALVSVLLPSLPLSANSG